MFKAKKPHNGYSYYKKFFRVQHIYCSVVMYQSRSNTILLNVKYTVFMSKYEVLLCPVPDFFPTSKFLGVHFFVEIPLSFPLFHIIPLLTSGIISISVKLKKDNLHTGIPTSLPSLKWFTPKSLVSDTTFLFFHSMMWLQVPLPRI